MIQYHFFFFQSLIFRGLKLRAFTFFTSVKSGLKGNQFFPGFSKKDKFVDSVNNSEESDSSGFDTDHKEVFCKKVLAYDDFLSNKLFNLYQEKSALEKRR